MWGGAGLARGGRSTERGPTEGVSFYLSHQILPPIFTPALQRPKTGAPVDPGVHGPPPQPQPQTFPELVNTRPNLLTPLSDSYLK